MRPIEFRAWDPDNKVMREYEYEKYVLMFNGVVGEFNGKQYDPRPHWILLQYTGLNDVTGTKIFVGDILIIVDPELDEQYVGIVKWGEDYPAFIVDCNELVDLEYNTLQHCTQVASCKVMGNIYEHPEFLKSL